MGPLSARAAGAALAAALLAACAGPVGEGAGAGGSGESAFRARPLGRAPAPRSGHLTWRLGAVERRGESGLRVDLRLHNGSHRGYRSLLLRVTVHGPEGEAASARVPVGGLLDDQSRSLSARFDAVPFPVADVTVELLYATP